MDQFYHKIKVIYKYKKKKIRVNELISDLQTHKMTLSSLRSKEMVS